MIVTIVAIVVIVWKAVISIIAHGLINSYESYEAKRDSDVDDYVWSSMRNDIKSFSNEFVSLNGGSYNEMNRFFIDHITVWIFSEYGFGLDDLRNSTKDKKQIKWYEQVYKNNDIFNKNSSLANYSSLYSGSWVEKAKSRIRNNAYECNKKKLDLESLRKKERKDALIGLAIIVLFYIVLYIVCQYNNNTIVIIVSLISLVYWIYKIPGDVKKIKDIKNTLNK